MEVLASENKERLDRVEHRWFLEAVGIGASGREREVLLAWQQSGRNKDNKKLANILQWRLNKVIPEISSNASSPSKEGK